MKDTLTSMAKTPRTVITSDTAKEHITNARSTMNEMNLSMALHKQNINNQQMQTQNTAKEKQQEIDKMNMQNQHELAMQTQKLNAVNALI